MRIKTATTASVVLDRMTAIIIVPSSSMPLSFMNRLSSPFRRRDVCISFTGDDRYSGGCGVGGTMDRHGWVGGTDKT